jgi:hypothetical protein
MGISEDEAEEIFKMVRADVKTFLICSNGEYRELLLSDLPA